MNYGFSYYFCLMIEDADPDPYGTFSKWIRIREAPKHTDPDPQHWLITLLIVNYEFGSHAWDSALVVLLAKFFLNARVTDKSYRFNLREV